MNSTPKIDANFYTQKEFIAYGDRLHINTALNTTINVTAIYIVLKYSTEAMKNYKPYILMTLITSFLMDFHITFIFGPFLMLPSNSMCGAGIICRHFGYLWGQLIPYALLHICISFVGFSIVLGFLYQYFSVSGNSDFFSSFRNRIIMLIIMILYPTPSLYIGFAHASNDFSMKTVAEDYPYLLQIFSNNGCYYVKIDAGGREFIISQVLQIVGVAIIAYTIAFKLHRKLASLKNVLSPATLKVRKQFFIALLLQFTIPSMFLVTPPVVALTLILFEYENAHLLSNYIMPIIALHSAFNALIVMFVITPYRLTLIRWFRYIFRIKQKPVIGLQPSLLSTSLTQHIVGQVRRSSRIT